MSSRPTLESTLETLTHPLTCSCKCYDSRQEVAPLYQGLLCKQTSFPFISKASEQNVLDLFLQTEVERLFFLASTTNPQDSNSKLDCQIQLQNTYCIHRLHISTVLHRTTQKDMVQTIKFQKLYANLSKMCLIRIHQYCS